MEYEARKFKKYVVRREKEKQEDFPFPEPDEIDLRSLPTGFFDDGSEEQIILRNKECIRGKRF